MAKLTLNLEQLEVESFATAANAEGEGTIRAHGSDEAATCVAHYTCDDTCADTCSVPASCELVNSYCGTYDGMGCAPTVWMCYISSDVNPCY